MWFIRNWGFIRSLFKIPFQSLEKKILILIPYSAHSNFFTQVFVVRIKRDPPVLLRRHTPASGTRKKGVFQHFGLGSPIIKWFRFWLCQDWNKIFKENVRGKPRPKDPISQGQMGPEGGSGLQHGQHHPWPPTFWSGPETESSKPKQMAKISLDFGAHCYTLPQHTNSLNLAVLCWILSQPPPPIFCKSLGIQSRWREVTGHCHKTVEMLTQKKMRLRFFFIRMSWDAITILFLRPVSL